MSENWTTFFNTKSFSKMWETIVWWSETWVWCEEFAWPIYIQLTFRTVQYAMQKARLTQLHELHGNGHKKHQLRHGGQRYGFLDRNIDILYAGIYWRRVFTYEYIYMMWICCIMKVLDTASHILGPSLSTIQVHRKKIITQKYEMASLLKGLFWPFH